MIDLVFITLICSLSKDFKKHFSSFPKIHLSFFQENTIPFIAGRLNDLQ